MAGRAIVSDEEDEIEEEVDEREVRDTEGADIDEGNDDDEDNEEGQDEYEKDDFIVDDVEEEEEQEEEEEEKDSDDKEKHKKKKRRKKESEKNYVLDEDDYELLQDNNITGFHRPKIGSKKFKRLKKAGRNSEQEEQTGFSDEEEIGRGGRSGRTAEEKLKRSLFGDDDGAPLEDIAEEQQPEEEEDGDIGEEDEMADFIVDEEDVDENGAPVRKKFSKKKSRQAPGVPSSAFQEAHDIFGDVDELLRVRKEGLARSDDMHKGLEDEFEPFILTEKYMTKKDNMIRETDVPERIQLTEEVTGLFPIDDRSIEDESTWVYNQLMSSDASPFFGYMELLGDINKEDIRNVLALHHVQKLDIPFIATYRKEKCLSLLKEPEQDVMDNEDKPEKPKIKWHRKLWAVQNLDKKWLLLQKQKRALRLYYKKRFQEEAQRVDHETRLNLNHDLSKSILKSLENAETDCEVNDVDMKFILHFPPGELGAEEGRYKRPQRKSKYAEYKNAGLWEVVGKFGFSSEQFGSLLTLEQMRQDELEDAKETPAEIAMNFTCNMIQTPREVLDRARYMAAFEISCEPCVRKHVRSIFLEKVVVSTCPTIKGKTAIDSFHQFAGIKWLRNKPLSEFKDSQWLLIQKAEEEKLLEVTIKLPEDTQNKILNDFNENYLSDGVSKSAQLWNEQRKLILNGALFSFLLPSMAKEVRILLTTRAKYILRMEYGGQLWSKASVAPYQRKDNEVGMDEDTVPRVMACCWGPGKPATTFVMLDSSGEVLDVLYAGSINTRSQSVEDQQRKKYDQQRLLKFMTDHQPQVVVLGAVNLSCTHLKDELFEIIFKIVEEHPTEVGQEIDEVKVVYGDESLPHLYENSRISSDQLPKQQGIVRRAVALGRYLQNPLAMIASLCGPAREILSWKLSPLEHLLTPDEKYEMIEQVMVDATNQVGLDINLAASHEWLFAPLQFISGLGPRKASGLQRALVRVGSVFSRKELMTDFIKKKVFFNAVAFLRVCRSGVATTSTRIVDLLDDTRIHPESYKLAKSMAKDVYDEDVQGNQNDSDDEVQEMAIEHVREQPKLLRVLDIDEYAKSGEERLGERKKETLYDIKMELLHGFQDWRTPYSEPAQDEEFYMISGETEESLAVGRVVQATVKRVQIERLTCALDSGLTGLIMKKDDFHQRRRYLQQDDLDFTPENFPLGMIIDCTVEKIQKNRYLVFLTLGEGKGETLPNLDPYYYEGESNLWTDQEKARKEKELAKKHFRPRMIVHPRFQNLTADEAIEFLSEKEPGESIIRPSSRGASYLTLTLKVYDGVYAHKDIAEGGKDHKDITSLLRIGKTLKIGEDTFEDLDEVMDRYVDPLVAHLKAMLGHRKFKRGTKAEVDELLGAEKAENPARIVYCFGICHEHPGTFILSYIRTNPHHIHITLYPKGFRFRSNFFDNIDRLVAHFQKHIDDLPREATQPNRSIAAMVPMKSPASVGFSAASGGWGGSQANSDGGWMSGHMNSQRERYSASGSRTGRNDYRNGDSRDGHPSGAPRSHGGHGQGRVAGSYYDGGNDNGGASKWGSASKGGDGWSNFPSSKVSSSPGRDAFSGGWDSSGSGSSGGAGGTRNGGSGNHENSNVEWGSAGGHRDSDSGGWGSSNRSWSNSIRESGNGSSNGVWVSSARGGDGGSVAAATDNLGWGGRGEGGSGNAIGSRGWSSGGSGGWS
ncbi:transcription elongation factor SPT6 homolog isoform X2 [Aristolochia californica]|uniref:transcription elongation factor SPT6 homolog isoform X2 n=1 Tax=Aristolochia californica TaxID=171875 RepID=UPI0035D883FD